MEPPKKRVSKSDQLSLLGLSRRQLHVLERANIHTVDNLLLAEHEKRLTGIRGLGSKSVEEIVSLLANLEIIDGKGGENTRLISQSNLGELVVESVSVESVLLWYRETIEKHIRYNLLHKDTPVAGRTIQYWMDVPLAFLDLNETLKIYKWLITNSINLSEELSILLQDIPIERIRVFVARYGYSPRTLEEIGNDNHLTRERIRQICERLEEKLSTRVSAIRDFPRISTALLLAADKGHDLTFAAWESEIRNSGLVGRWNTSNFAEFNAIELLVCLCRALEDRGSKFVRLPDNLAKAVELAASGRATTPVRFAYLKLGLTRDQEKLITRHIRFTGAISVKWLSHELRVDELRTHDLLHVAGFTPFLSDEWWVFANREKGIETNKMSVFHNSLRKLFLYCGPLDVEEICSALRNAVSRTTFPVPPPLVMSQLLLHYGYQCEDSLYYWNGEATSPLSTGEELILECLKEKGTVVHHAELAQKFIESPVSFPLLHGTLRRSPLFKQARKGLYMLRGTYVTSEDIERALMAADRTPADVEVRYIRTGSEIRVTLGILAVAVGEIVSNDLPDISGQWHCFVGDKQFKDIRATQSNIRGLQRVFEYLNCQVRDRVSLEFNVVSRNVKVSKMGGKLG